MLYEEDYERGNKGIKALYQVLVTEMGLEAEKAKDLVVRYPVILQKSENDIRKYFTVLARHQIPKK